jgi:hypothetical protein
MRWLLIVVAVLVAIVGVVALVGATLPQNHVASRTVRLSAPVDTVWSLVTDVARYPTWRKDVSSVEIVEGKPLLTWREVSGKDRMTYEATESEPRSHFVAHIADKGLPFGGSWDYRVVPDGTGTTITITENGEVYNPIFRLVSKYVIGHTASIDKYLSALSVRSGNAAGRK